MPRTVTSTAQTELDKTAIMIVPVVVIDWGGAAGVKTYSTVASADSGLTAEKKLSEISGGGLQLEPESVGKAAEVDVVLKDTDRSIKGYVDAVDPQGRSAQVYYFVVGTTWGTDEVKIVDGVVARMHRWNESIGSYGLTIADLGQLANKEIGKTVTGR